MAQGTAMLWEVEIQQKGNDPDRERVRQEYALVTHNSGAAELLRLSARGYLLEGNLPRDQAQQMMDDLLVDPLVERGRLAEHTNTTAAAEVLTVLFKPGVMDPTAQSGLELARG